MSIQANISEEKKALIKEIFLNMNTIDAPESDALGKKWIREKPLGPFINGSYVSTSSECLLKGFEDPSPLFHTTDAAAFQSAISAASGAFDAWKSDQSKRANLLLKVADCIEQQKQLFAMLECFCRSKMIRRIRADDVTNLLKSFRECAHSLISAEGVDGHLEPYGVVLVIVSNRNCPMLSLCWRVAQILAAGNTLILQADPASSFSALFLAELVKHSGVPDGVFNVLPLSLSEWTSLEKTTSMDLSKLLLSVFPQTSLNFDKSKHKSDIEMLDTSPIKKVFINTCPVDSTHLMTPAICDTALEVHVLLPPTVLVFEGCDIDSAVAGTLESFLRNYPQSGAAGCRVFVQDCVKELFTSKLRDKFKNLKRGSALSASDVIDCRPLVSDTLTVAEVRKLGGKIVCLSDPSDSSLASPALIYDIQTTSPLVRKTTFGQFLTVISFRSKKEGVTIFNHQKSGSDVSIWCENISAALQVADLLKTANVWVNCQNVFDTNACYGSVYSAGHSVNGGSMGIYSYMKQATDESFIYLTGTCPAKEDSKYPFLRDMFKLFINGALVHSENSSIMKVKNCTGDDIAFVPNGSAKDIDSAVESALAALSSWQGKSTFERSQLLKKLAKGLSGKHEQFSLALQVSTLRDLADCTREVDETVKRLYYWSSCWNKYNGSIRETSLPGKVLESLEPLGVIGIVCPDDCPLLSLVSLFAPCVLRGSATVIVPSEKFPLPALLFCQVLSECATPKGVVNIISGPAQDLSQSLFHNMEVESLWLNRKLSLRTVTTENRKYIWFGKVRNWFLPEGQSLEFIREGTFCKTVWLPAVDIF